MIRRDQILAWFTSGTMTPMSQADPASTDSFELLDPVERAWLQGRLREYEELLTYLRDH